MTAATLHPGILDDVLRNPGDDTPRLVMADWLEDEGGDPARAEFIRLQVELARPHDKVKPGAAVRFASLLRRERDLLFDAWARWLLQDFDRAAFHVTCAASDNNDFRVTLYGPGKRQVGEFRCSFQRGFVGEVRTTVGNFFRHAGAMFACAPVGTVAVTDRETNGVGAGRRWWSRANYDDSLQPPWWLPQPIFDLLPYDPAANSHPGTNRGYPSDAAALDALSAACVLFGRKEAGLS